MFVERPQEEQWSPDEKRYQEAKDWVDMWVSVEEDGFVAAAKRFGIPELS
jgi:2-haloacid dehalogenase